MGSPTLPTFYCSSALWIGFLLAIQWVGTGFSCPGGCNCEKWNLNCTSAGLEEVPKKISAITRELILSRNRIKVLPPLEMTYLNELVYLDCSHNLITMNQEYKFPWVEKLAYLDLSFNKITHLTHRTFSRLNKLLLLNISSNPTMQVIKERTFVHNPLLRYVDISDCNLTHLSATLFRDQYNLHTLGLRNNPFLCDCNLLELINWLLKPKVNWEILDPDNTACDMPGMLKFVPILQAEEYLHAICLSEGKLKDHAMTALLTFSLFVGGTVAAWLMGVVSVIYYHPGFKTEDDSDNEQEYEGI